MGSETPLTLPIVDFSKVDLKPGTSYWEVVRAQVREALEEYGCFEAVYDKVPLELHKEVFGSLEELFDLPTETKKQITYDKPYDGYVGQSPMAPLKEGIGIDDATPEEIESFTNRMWSNGNASFCETVQSFYNRVSELDQMVKRMVFESFGVEKNYDSLIESTKYLFRVMKYKGTQMEETKVGAPSHTDKSFLTILHQNQINGLEVQTRNGEWISVKPSASSFIIMNGDAFLAWSNGRFHSPVHRVMMNGNDARYCIALFSNCKGIIQIPEELVDEEHPLLFKPFDHMEFLRFSTERGVKAESAIKAYCGV